MDTNPLSGSQAKGENKLGGSQAKGEEQITSSQGERVISERVVSERVLGRSNPLARMGRSAGSQISSRLGGILIGLILIIISFFVVWHSENLEKSSAAIKKFPLLSAEQAVGKSGMVKIQGLVTSTPIKNAKDPRDLLYYHQTREELEMVKSTETETRVVTKDGQDIEQTIEREVEKPEWVSKLDEEKWAPIVLANKIGITKPEAARRILNLTSIFSDVQEKVRENVGGVLANEPLIVIGEINNDMISGGHPFIISNLSDLALIASLESSESTAWWLWKLATLLLFGIGLYLLLGPVLLVLDIIPVLGNIGKTGLLIVCLLIGLVFTVFSSIIINYWYIILIIIIALAVYLVSARKFKSLPQKPA
jgi:hypothetical protein